jgi:hypothetical protein
VARPIPAITVDEPYLPKQTVPFAGPPSPLVSRAALFTSAVTVSKRGGISGRKKKKSGGFEQSETHMNSSIEA